MIKKLLEYIKEDIGNGVFVLIITLAVAILTPVFIYLLRLFWTMAFLPIPTS